MTKSEIRRARRLARAEGLPLLGKLALLNGTCTGPKPKKRVRAKKVKEVTASREEQHGRYLDAGPQAWDDR